MDFSEISKELNLGEAYLCWKLRFEESAFFVEKIRAWLSSEKEMRRNGQFVGLTNEMITAVLNGSHDILSSPALLRLMAHLHCMIFEWSGFSKPVDGLIALPNTIGPMADMLYVYVFLSGVSNTVERFKIRNIADAVIARTLSDLKTRMEAYYAKTGRWGIDVPPWLVLSFHAHLIAFERLQFQPGIYQGLFRVYQHRREKRSVAVMASEQLFRADGQFSDADDGQAEKSECWVSIFEENDKRVTANPVVSRKGTLARQEVLIDLNDWKVALQVGDPILAIHIPATGPLSREVCQADIRSSMEFFRKHYPELAPFKALVCNSWLLDPQLADQLRTDSNILHFQSLFDHLVPVPGANDSQMFERVFNNRRGPTNALPADNSLRRTLIAHMRAGKCCRNGAGFILRANDLA